MDYSGGFIPAPSPPTSRTGTPNPSSPANLSSTQPANPSPLANSTVPGSQPETASLSLENELGNVMASLGGFWGKVRKQSVTAFKEAEKQLEKTTNDLTPLVSKARANLDSLSETTKAEFARLSEASSQQGGGVAIGVDGMPVIMDQPQPSKEELEQKAAQEKREEKGKGVDPSERGTSESTSAPEDVASPNPGAAAAAFFTKLQSQVAASPNLQGLSTQFNQLQHQLSENLHSLPASLQTNLNQLQSQLPASLTHLDAKQAEQYLQKGESWLAEFGTEVQRLAKEAVRVVPPGEDAMSDERARKKEERLRKAEQVAMGRRDQLVLKLRADKAGLLVDPAQPVEGAGSDRREAYAKFLQAIEDTGGFEGEKWLAKVAKEIEQGGEQFKKTIEQLVPATLSKEAFWSRYLFAVQEIDEDEQRRRKVLEVTEEKDDDFSWDMEDEEEEEETSAVPAPTSNVEKPTLAALAVPSTTSDPITAPDTPRQATVSSASSDAGDWGLSPALGSQSPVTETSPTLPTAVSPEAPSTTSPRTSSDGTAASYDLVGERSGAPSSVGGDETSDWASRRSSKVGDGSVEDVKPVQAVEEKRAPATPTPASASKPEKEDSDEDSDWE